MLPQNILGGVHTAEEDGPLNKSHYYKVISDIMGYIHSKIPTERFNTAHVPVSADKREEHFQGVNYNRRVIYLLSNGCEWAIKNSNGCTMCGHLAKQTRKLDVIPTEDFISQFTDEFNKIDFSQYPILNLYNNGSILNDREIPHEARTAMLKIISADPHIIMLVLETRPEYVTEAKVAEIKQLIPDKHVELAMGLEIKDNFLRSICINKGFSLEQYNRAAEIITKHLNLRTYVLLKPAFLTEKEAIDNAIATVEHAFAMKCSTVSLEACTVQDYTLVQYLYDRKLYQTPWLWSILEVVKATHHLGKIIVGLFQFFPSPSMVPYNCDKCSSKVLEAIREYNRTLDIKYILEADKIECECKDRWRKELAEEPIPFEQRIEILNNVELYETV